MSALGHYLETEGLSTTQISLIRPHTEKIKPPRALWVPFELGRPFGPPGDAVFQRRVLMAALDLLDRRSGPVLEDFPDDVPENGTPSDGSGWVCPVALGAPPTADAAPGSLTEALGAEMHQLRPWYDIGRNTRGGRTTVGVSRMAIEDLVPFITSFLDGKLPPNPRDDVPLADCLKYASEDLKSFYLEAASAQPGHQAGTGELENWFWDETAAARVFYALRPILMKSEDDLTRLIGARALIPALQRERQEKAAASR